jgi:predicted DNA-binding transcriptional regulator YafY
MDKWEKVVTLHRLLNNRTYAAPLSTIREELECSLATFHRIRNFMQPQLGAPIEFDHKHGGYRYAVHKETVFELPGLWLKQTEIAARIAAMRQKYEKPRSCGIMSSAEHSSNKKEE